MVANEIGKSPDVIKDTVYAEAKKLRIIVLDEQGYKRMLEHSKELLRYLKRETIRRDLESEAVLDKYLSQHIESGYPHIFEKLERRIR